MWSTSVLGAVQPAHWQEGYSRRVRVRREDQGARSEGWSWSHRVCAEGARSTWAGHRDDPEGVRREHPGWVHLVGGMVGVMAPAYTAGCGGRNCGHATLRPRHAAAAPIWGREPGSARCGTGHTLLPRARPRIFLYPFFLPYLYSLSLSL